VRILDAFNAPQDADPLQFETISLPEELALPVSHDFGGCSKRKIIAEDAADYQSFLGNYALDTPLAFL